MSLRGTWPLVRLIVARDRVRILVWLIGIVALVWVTAASTKGLYSSQADLDAIAKASHDNPVALAFNGPDLALDTIGGQVVFQMSAFGLLIVGLMNLLLVGRFTRGEEDSGRLELVRAMPVGRHAPLAAGLLVMVVADLALGAAVTLVLLGQGLATLGCLVLGASWLGFGLVFVAITAVSAQVSENPRVATGSAGAVLGASFAIRAVGDIGTGTLSWFSPMGWAQQTRPFAGETPVPLLLLATATAGLGWLAAVLASRRDFGSGLIPPRAGPARAAPGLSSALGLAVRLHRGAVFWWLTGVLALALVYGSLANEIQNFLGDNPDMERVIAALGGGDITDAYLATSLLVISLLAAGPGMQIAGRLRAEEAAQHAEPLLATPVSRPSWLFSHLIVAFGATALCIAAGGLGLGAAYGVSGGGARQVPRLVVSSLAYIPAVWLLVAIAIAVFGVRPRWTAVAWGALAGCFVIGMFGSLLDLPSIVLDLSPLQHTPALPAARFRVLPIVVLSALTAGLVTFGTVRFRERDVVPT